MVGIVDFHGNRLWAIQNQALTRDRPVMNLFTLFGNIPKKIVIIIQTKLNTNDESPMIGPKIVVIYCSTFFFVFPWY